MINTPQTLTAEQPQISVGKPSKRFTTEVGTYISEQEALKLRRAYFTKEKEKHNHEEFIRSHFFGKDKLLELLSYHSEIVGMRIYYGVDEEETGMDNKKIVLYPVDKYGKDVLIGDKALDGGIPCPPFCPLF
jgi:hypothetical protein